MCLCVRARKRARVLSCVRMRVHACARVRACARARLEGDGGVADVEGPVEGEAAGEAAGGGFPTDLLSKNI